MVQGDRRVGEWRPWLTGRRQCNRACQNENLLSVKLQIALLHALHTAFAWSMCWERGKGPQWERKKRRWSSRNPLLYLGMRWSQTGVNTELVLQTCCVFLHSFCIHWSKQTVWNVCVMSSAMKKCQNFCTADWNLTDFSSKKTDETKLERSVKSFCWVSQIIRTLPRMSQMCCWSTRSVSARRRWRTCSTQPHRRYVKHFELPLFIKFAIQIHLRLRLSSSHTGLSDFNLPFQTCC